ncbi:MAG: CBS and ACT domain-containing protein [Thermodesulfobacteriota bacterium]
MLVKEWMTKNPITAEEDTSLMEVSQLMREKKIRRMPILSKKGQLVGIVTDRDIKAASPSKATTLDVHELYYLLSKIKIKDIMSKKPVTISPEDTVMRAAVLMLEKKISGLPVLDEKEKLVGILSQGDVFRVLTTITGIYRGGMLFAFELEDRGGTIKEVADVIRAAGGRMTSILTSYETASEGWRHVFIRVQGVSDDKAKALAEELKSKFRFLYYVKDELKK